MARGLDEIDGRLRAHMLLLLDSRKREQIVDETRHAPALIAHDRQELVARPRVRVRRALQGLDEAEQRGERRAQFMAGVGDEVGAHALDAPRFREIAHGQKRRDDLVGLGGERGDADLEQPLDGHALAPERGLRLARQFDVPDRIDDIGRAQRQHERFANPQRGQQRERGLVGGGGASVLADDDRGLGHRAQQLAGERPSDLTVELTMLRILRDQGTTRQQEGRRLILDIQARGFHRLA